MAMLMFFISSYSDIIIEREVLMQKYIHLVQIVETEKVAANQLRTQLEDQDTEIERLKSEVLQQNWDVIPSNLSNRSYFCRSVRYRCLFGPITFSYCLYNIFINQSCLIKWTFFFKTSKTLTLFSAIKKIIYHSGQSLGSCVCVNVCVCERARDSGGVGVIHAPSPPSVGGAHRLITTGLPGLYKQLPDH